MQKNIPTFYPLRWAAIILLAAFSFAACESKETKKTEIEVKKDSLPPLDTTNKGDTTRPETIKN